MYRKAHLDIGKTFGRLTVLSVIRGRKSGRMRAVMNCRCSCGNEVKKDMSALRNKDSISCGCYLREILSLPTPQRPKTTRSSKNQKPEAKRTAQIKWVKNNPEKVAAIAKRHRDKHAAKVKAAKADYYQRNKRRIVDKINMRFATDPRFRIESLLRSRLRKMVKRANGKKCGATLELLGCSLNLLRACLEAQFTESMTWEAFMRGEIHIDHEIPCAAFDLTDPEPQRRCFHYSNLRPRWAVDNLRKSDKLPNGQRVRDVKRRLRAPASDIPVPASPLSLQVGRSLSRETVYLPLFSSALALLPVG